MPFDNVPSEPRREAPKWPPAGMWAPPAKLCRGDCKGRVAYGQGEECSWCGLTEGECSKEEE